MDDNIEKAADHEAEQSGGKGKHRRIGEQCDHPAGLTDNGTELEDRQVHGNHQSADKNPEEYHDHRFHQT